MKKVREYRVKKMREKASEDEREYSVRIRKTKLIRHWNENLQVKTD